jgi:branched-chain amino acid aminotransferase
MPCLIKFLTPDTLETAPYSATSLADAARFEPHDGVYTITNTYNTTQVLKLDAHLNRLEDSAHRASIPFRVDRPRLRAALRSMIEEAGYGDVRFRVTVPKDQPDKLILSVEPFTPLAASIVTNGVRCVTVKDAVRHDPAAKTTDWMHDRGAIEKALPSGVYTGLLLGEGGEILEGLSSNFYAIYNGELRTAGEGVLLGIAQQIVFEIASRVLPLRKEAVNVADIPRLSEVFITSSSRGIVPVIEIDNILLGDGKPGAQTMALRQEYLQWMESHLEEL